MIPLLSILWPGLAGALALGLAVGGYLGFPGRWIAPFGLLGLTLLLGGSAASGMVSGAVEFGVESATLMLAAYLVGCTGGALALRSRSAFAERRSDP